MIKVAYISRSTLYTSPGGDTVQILETAAHINKLGVQADVFLSNEGIDYAAYDLLHFFNIIRPADILHHISKSGKPYVVSTIFVQYGTVNIGGMQSLLRRVLGESGLEYIKVIARAIKNNEKIVSTSYLWMGHRKAIKHIIKNAACLLPNSASEYRRLAQTYDIEATYRVVPNGIDEKVVSKQYPQDDTYKDSIICMGRIEARKNQLNLIRALNNTKYKLFIHGKPSPNAQGYFEQCQQEAASNVYIKDWISTEQLYRAYSSAKVHVLASYFETTGLSSLEAAVMGCNIVISDKGDTRDYFGDNAWYCEPDDVNSIREAVDMAFEAPYNNKFREYILQHYTWARAAEETLKAYKQVLSTN